MSLPLCFSIVIFPTNSYVSVSLLYHIFMNISTENTRRADSFSANPFDLYKTRFLQNKITDSTHSDSEACATRYAEDDLKYSRI